IKISSNFKQIKWKDSRIIPEGKAARKLEGNRERMPVAKPVSSQGRVIAHVDMDCFYVQVEQRKNPELRGLPSAVVQYNSWKGGGLIAVSYEARKFGVKRSMRGDEAKEVCPEIQLVQVPVARGKADLNTYRSAGSEVVSILSKTGRCERASIDEVYIDLTDAAETMLAERPPESIENLDEEALKIHVLGLSQDDNARENVRQWLCRSDADHNDKLLACGALIVADLRAQVLRETEFTCSAGVAHNKMLAKLASGMNKPAQQTIVPSSSVKELLASLPIKKMKQLGGKLGDSLQNDLGVKTVGDVLQFSEEKLQERYGINTGTWLWNIARGISGEEVEGRILPKSHGSGKTFSGPCALKTLESVEHWLNELCEELNERLLADLDHNRRVAHTLTVHARAYKLHGTDSQKNFPSKSSPLRYGIAKLKENASTLFQAGLREFTGLNGVKIENNQKNGWAITGLSVSASKIVAIPLGTCSIMKFFHSQNPTSTSLAEQSIDKSKPAELSHTGSDADGESNQVTEIKESEVTQPSDVMHDSNELEPKRNLLDNQVAGSIIELVQNQVQFCSQSNESHVHEASCSMRPENNSWSGNSQPNEVEKDKFVHSSRNPLEQQEQGRKEINGTSPIMNFWKGIDHSSSRLKRERGGGTNESASEQAWSLKPSEIDQTVIDELPPEIQEEVRAWLRPLKQSHANTTSRSRITSYFLPTTSRDTK
ncbi:hypothetical protein V2J09_016202, partial [Rumex salicifolius]